jgi:lipoate-protein ligase A
MTTCLVLPLEVECGPANMALDEALLDAAACNGRFAYLRFYGWSIPTLSLGYFQHIAEVQADPRWQSVPLVRRLTGGGAIWHHHEVTYTVVVPAGYPHARPSTTLYRVIHGAIAGALSALGVPADRRGEPTARRPPERKRPLLCFTDPNSEDIVANGLKLVGSAQRRRDGAVLQHGSLLLARSPRVPEMRGVCDVADVPRSIEYWATHLAARVAEALGLRCEFPTLADSIRARAIELERTIYRTPAWTRSRQRTLPAP